MSEVVRKVTREARVLGCDGPDCNRWTERETMESTRWIRVQQCNRHTYDDTTWHFCSDACLLGWVSQGGVSAAWDKQMQGD